MFIQKLEAPFIKGFRSSSELWWLPIKAGCAERRLSYISLQFAIFPTLVLHFTFFPTIFEKLLHFLDLYFLLKFFHANAFKWLYCPNLTKGRDIFEHMYFYIYHEIPENKSVESLGPNFYYI